MVSNSFSIWESKSKLLDFGINVYKYITAISENPSVNLNFPRLSLNLKKNLIPIYTYIRHANAAN